MGEGKQETKEIDKHPINHQKCARQCQFHHQIPQDLHWQSAGGEDYQTHTYMQQVLHGGRKGFSSVGELSELVLRQVCPRQ